jgi:hypothetical protein
VTDDRWVAPGSTPGVEPPVYQPPPPAQVMPGQVLPPSAIQPGYGSSGQPSYGGPAYPAPGYGPAPTSGYGPASGYGYYGGPPAPPPPRFAPPPPMPRPPPANANAIRVDAIQGTSFGVAYPAIPPVPNGAAITSMVAGILSILIAFAVGCFGITGAEGGWGPTVSGAFAVLSAFVGAGAIFIGIRALRVIRESQGAASGRGLAITGISCGGSGVGLTVLFFLVAVLAAV